MGELSELKERGGRENLANMILAWSILGAGLSDRSLITLMSPEYLARAFLSGFSLLDTSLATFEINSFWARQRWIGWECLSW